MSSHPGHKVSNERLGGDTVPHSVASFVRRHAVAIIVAWIGVVAALNILVPQLETVGHLRSVSLSPAKAPGIIAIQRLGAMFNEHHTDSVAMLLIEDTAPLSDRSRKYYNELIAKLRADTRHVQYVQDLWSDPLTAPGAESNDGRSVYAQVYLNGTQGEALANESVEAVQAMLHGTPGPSGLKAFLTGPAVVIADQQLAGDRSMRVIVVVTFAVIVVMLLLVYRSVTTVVLVLVMVVLQLAAARGVVALLAYHELIGLSIFTTNMLVTLVIAAGTDYAIFLVGRYQEAGGAGQDRESAYFTMFGGTAHVVLGSGLTIAGAMLCLSFTRLPYLQTLGVPLAVGMTVGVLAALTLGPAVIAVAGRFGAVLEPRRQLRVRRWRKLGAAIARWPGPILIGAGALSLVGLSALPGYRANFNDRNYLPKSAPANVGYAAAERSFGTARMNPDVLLVESGHDLRNSAELLVIDKIAKALFRVEGISRVQAITRPDGKPIKHTSIPFMIGMQSSVIKLNQPYQQQRMADLLTQADEMQTTIDTMEQMTTLTAEMAAATHRLVLKTHAMLADVEELRDAVANFEDTFRPIRSYFYWEKHCADIPVCWSLRSIFDAIDGVDVLTGDLQQIIPEMDRLDVLLPQMVALMPQMTQVMRAMKVAALTMYATQKGMLDQMAATMDNTNAMGEAFDASMNDDSFYLPPEVLQNADFQRAMKNFISPDGKSVRFIISHQSDPMSPEGMASTQAIKRAATEAIKGTPLEGAKIYLAGTAAVIKDINDGNDYDLLIAAIAALSLIFIIMLVITRSAIAALVIVGTVAASLGASLGLSVLLWQHVLGIELHWLVLSMSVIVLLAVGADYNLLLVSRLREEIQAGIRTAIIRTLGATGSVVTSAGLVFAFTMISMAVSELTTIAQIGTTIGLGLLFDTLIVRALITPSIAVLLGRWFWWPQRARPRPAPQAWPEPSQSADNHHRCNNSAVRQAALGIREHQEAR
ncbi:RND family transporter [Mycobacterium sp. TY815]|uniref:MMPL/RND family transporter n=1 Tax=Mycobacterium sp. TY815 TaxID=3050581 RepID=UPI0027419872|nr:MMPL family transporter [Mycobacterium sp. TY815]MDP7702464.1 MMPL family transporter [Mycobacterium sp. TY815]